MSKLLSVIVPVYNVEKYLKKCIESILNQTYKNLELILVDDGSSDNCPGICDEYALKDSRVIVIHKENGGQGSARNRGLDIATGEYVAFADSDDFLDLEMYEIMISTLERTESDLVFCGFKTYSGIREAYSEVPKEEKIWNGPEEMLREYFENTAVFNGPPWNKVFHRKAFETLRYPEGVAREDVYIMHLAFANCNRAVHTCRHLYNYTIREGSSEHQEFHPKYLVSIKIADDRWEYIKENFPTLEPLAYRSCYGARISAIGKIVRSGSEKEFKDTLNELKKFLKENKPVTKEQAKLRRQILYFPLYHKFRMNLTHKWRKKTKKLVLKMIGKGKHNG